MGSVQPAKGGVDVSIALAPCNIDVVPKLIEEISRRTASATSGDEAARLELAEKARSLVRALETPRETMIKHCWAQPTVFTAITFGVDIGLFKLLAESDDVHNAYDLAETLGVDPPLLCRLLRHLGTMGYLTEVGPDQYLATNFAKSLSIPIISDGYPCIGGGLSQCIFRFNEFAKHNGYKTPTDVSKGALQYAYATENNFFEHLHSHPPYGIQFNNHMGGYRQGRPSWMDDGFYPVKERLVDGADTSPEAAFIVDIGGSLGHDIRELHRKNGSLPGRLILQDLPVVIGQITDLDSRIERMEHDFHLEQPVKGARAYYMHSVLHDWPDEVCGKILGRIKEAMKPGYSRLLVNENVIPPVKASWEATALDIMMLTLLSSRERTEADWHHVLEDIGGLKITKIWTAANGVESIIECERPSA
ncbi:hydroxyindole O-methyltransferase [Grosmannia clavigera kw1407]|uniref:Hydroxyindole O-methyltransferase n=1 Tax=Grosmannia clavigera (strain kw1407 / UAMH 11150) TaxID=655863 RepID=F0XNN8_GROCL|nr:hydroxyindole O-methyltransferase [Grosmannia clavigera kw1407]EFX00449.1 hydroxyindole O-methyltransferase [Grosmannia clavigera kw1407]